MADRLAPAPPPLVGGRYEVRGPLGQGGMGAVYRAYDRLLEREVALKQVLGVDGSAEREGRAAAPLTHPGFARTYDVVRDGEARYLVIELVQGPTLRELLDEQGRLGLPLALDVAARLADALHHAHTAGVVHADVKPSNVVLDEMMHPKLVDFGISRRGEWSGGPIGSPRCAAPEQHAGDAPNPRTDVYQVGLLLAEMLGAPPSADGQPPAIDRALPWLPRGLRVALDWALRSDPSERFPSAVALRDALEAVRQEANEATGVLDARTATQSSERGAPAKLMHKGLDAAPVASSASPRQDSPSSPPQPAGKPASEGAIPADAPPDSPETRGGITIVHRPLRERTETHSGHVTTGGTATVPGWPQWLTHKRVLPISALATVMLIALWFLAPQSSAAYCAPGVSPRFEEGLAVLRDEIGETMGRPTECLHRDPESGDLHQATSTGLAYVRASSGRPNFTNGSEHWALEGNQVLYWIGSSIDPPRSAQASPTRRQSAKPAAKGR